MLGLFEREVVIFTTFENQFLEAFFSTTWKIGK